VVTSGPAEGGEAGAEALFAKGDMAVLPGAGAGGGSGGSGKSGLGLGTTGDGAKMTGLPLGVARLRGGYQIKPRYPESARRQGIQGTSLLTLRVLADGAVGEVLVEQSAGHPDLDRAAVEAVKTWRFEPARSGGQPVAVWVKLPVRFELRR
jgi:protein TonB